MFVGSHLPQHRKWSHEQHVKTSNHPLLPVEEVYSHWTSVKMIVEYRRE